MQGEDATDERGCWSASTGSPVRRCTSVDNSMPECSRVVESPVKSTATCMSAPSALQCSNTSSDGKTRRYVRSNVPRLNWTDDLRRCFIRAIEELGGPQKATPKAILHTMNVSGLKIAHIKSHLQMYRNPRSAKDSSPRFDLFRSNLQMQTTSRDSNCEVEGPWKSWEREAATVETSYAKDYYAESFTLGVSTPVQLNHTGQCVGNFASLSPSQRNDVSIKPADARPASASTISAHPNTYDLLEMRIDGDNEQLASELMLATRQRSQVEISAAWNEQPRVQSRDSRNDLTLSNAPLELTMSLQPPQPHPDPYVRSEILTLDLTQQLNRPRLEPPR